MIKKVIFTIALAMIIALALHPQSASACSCAILKTPAEAAGPGVELTRTQTLMQGATHCDFCYRMK